MKSPILITFALVVITLSSCRKDGASYNGNCTGNCLTFKGRLVEQQVDTGMANVSINFYFDKNSSGLGGNGSTELLGVIKTQSDGSYEFSVPSYYRNLGGRFVFAASVPGYVNKTINSENSIAKISSNSITDSLIETELELWKAASFRLQVRTVSTSSFDQFYFNQRFSNVWSNNFPAIKKSRQPFDVSFELVTAADIPTVIVWRTDNIYGTTGSVRLEGSDTIIANASTPNLLTIEL